MKKDIETIDEVLSKPKLSYSTIENEMKVFSGKILTLIDASKSDETQNRAMKDIFKREVRDLLVKLQSISLPEGSGQKTAI